ncbi:MAG: hypothetical protein RL735_246, partial [Pseudomonadota bacterium]
KFDKPKFAGKKFDGPNVDKGKPKKFKKPRPTE